MLSRPLGGLPRPALAAALIVLLLALPAAGAAPVAPARPFPAPPLASHAVSSPHAPGLPVPGREGRRPQPEATSSWYVQVGLSLNKLNGSLGSTREMSEDVVLPSVTTQTAVELNGVSSTGDWYQVTVAHDWCGSGYYYLIAGFDSAGTPVLLSCGASASFSTGDEVELTLNLTSSSTVCFLARDLTHAFLASNCTTQLDTGATQFVTTSGITSSSTSGYFTGPMTESIVSGSGCPDLSPFASVEYRWKDPFWVTGYTPWSDSFNAGSGSVCYSGAGNPVTLAADDPTTHVVNTASGTAYGPHDVAGQNLSFLEPPYDLQVETDSNPPTSATATASAAKALPGETVRLAIASVTGGVSPYTGLWFENGRELNETALAWNFSTLSDGVYEFQGFAVDAQLSVVAASPWLNVTVVGPLTVGAPTASPAARVDARQPFELFGHPSGGLPPYSFAWTGLPPGCVGGSSLDVNCSVASVGAWNASVTVTDTNGSNVTSAPISIQVVPTLTGSLVASSSLEVGVAATLRANFSGGSAPVVYNWSGAPPGCSVGTSAVVPCDPSEAGGYVVDVVATDANGFLSAAPAVRLKVVPALTVALNSSVAQPEVGQSVRLAALVGGGGPVTIVRWSGLPAACAPNSTSSLNVSCVFLASGVYPVAVNVTDALGGRVGTPALVLSVFPGPAVTLSSAATSVAEGGRLSVEAVVSGGDPPFRFQWGGLPSGCTPADVPSLTCQPNASGSFDVTVTVVDAAGVGTHASLNVTVRPASSSPSPAGSPSWALPVGIVAGAVIAVVALVLFFLRRGSRGPPPRDDAP